ncbi:ABC transporter ATP-binding protein [Bifidobacterium choladohabitans]|uniref:ABC transporter ATP-binding protein n=1 Tax=Bifidobacterium choladohabitans TaxID=2750947 RepID=UPI0022B62158|nr:ABC transporter ATP-binding protein [Bifidobacterium choladohabitans]
MRRSLVMHILHLPFKDLDQSHTGNVISIISSDTNELKRLLTDGLPEVFGTLLVFIGACVGMVIISPVMFVISLSTCLVTVGLLVVLSGKLQDFSRGAQTAIGDMTSAATDALMGLKTIRAFNATEQETDIISEKAKQAYTFGRLISKKQSLIQPSGMALMQLCLMIVLGIGAFQVVKGVMTVQQLVTFSMYLEMMFTPMATLSSAFSSLFRALGAYSRIQAIMGMSTEDATSAGAVSCKLQRKIPNPDRIDIDFDHVDFSYDDTQENRGKLQLNDVSVHMKGGDVYAIVGPSGAGKSTMLALIEAFYKPNHGHILFNGVDISTLSSSYVHSLIGYVEQDAPIYSGSFRTNLAMNKNDVSDEDCWDALNKVNLAQKVRGTSDGLDTLVGERGVLLSGGERQRLALARLLLIKRPIILLDETTSNLDAKNEELVTQVIHANFPEQTIVMVAHRLESIASSDRIIVLASGTINGVGTHADLSMNNPLYQQLCRNTGMDDIDLSHMQERCINGQ